MARVVLVNYGDGTTGRRFDCPGCGNPHDIPVTGPKAWTFNGDDDRPTFGPSIFVNRERLNPTAHACHSHVRDGRIEYLEGTTHDLAGQTVDLPEVS